MKVLFFASLREQLGVDEVSVSPPAEVLTAAALRSWLSLRGEPWDQALGEDRSLMCAIDEQLAPLSASIEGARSVAFFPPVTGG